MSVLDAPQVQENVAPPPEPLKLGIAPYMVQDFGLNLYTSLPKVLAEFVANAYDADSPGADISIDFDRISEARAKLAGGASADTTLPEELAITIADEGVGMTREEIQAKFLQLGRRRRGSNSSERTAEGRIVMGRKGLGKLAGFGVAQMMIILTRAKGADYATKFTLDFKEIEALTSLNEYEVPEEHITDPSELPNSGTTIFLKRLLVQPTKVSPSDISEDLAEHFYFVDPSEFAISLNGLPIDRLSPIFAYAHPQPELDFNELVSHTITPIGIEPYEIKYRIRFTGDGEALPAAKRGVRVYTHNRLASLPSLLDANTNMHGFRMTDYLDGVVYADIIDEQGTDLVATDRQGLRWTTPMLAPLRVFISDEIKKACYAQQTVREKRHQAAVKSEPIVSKLILDKNLSQREARTLRKIAAATASATKRGFNDPSYEPMIRVLSDAYVQGNLFSELENLASGDNPDFIRLSNKIVSLTQEELDGFFKFCRGRITGIEGLRKLVSGTDFKLKKNEDELHNLLKQCPWLIDPTYFEFLTSNKTQGTVLQSLAKELQIEDQVPSDYDPTVPSETEDYGANLRPDLVFLLQSMSLGRIVIVELKAPNTPLLASHLTQLRNYMDLTNDWLSTNGSERYQVYGYLIGTHAKNDSKQEGVYTLRKRMAEITPKDPYQVISLVDMLTRTSQAHHEILSMEQTDP